MPFFYWKLGQKVRTMSVAQGNTDFSDATRVSSQCCRESILSWFLAKVGSGVRLNIAYHCGGKRWAGFLPALTCASAGPQGWSISTSFLPNCLEECKTCADDVFELHIFLQTLSQVCCAGAVHSLNQSHQCCEERYIPASKDSGSVCCGGQFVQPLPQYQCCGGYYILVPPGMYCIQP